MKCKNCNGNLKYENGYYICENCGSKYTVTDYYEDIDTFICYVENDDTNRRTKDSIIAQDLYYKLEAKKIRTFYGRISAANLINDEYENACNAAIHSAKTVLIIGTRKENFEILHEKYSSFYDKKVIIPVYANMNPKEIPNGISAIQALDYNKIGSDVDLIKSLQNALGRTDEEQIYSTKSQSKTKAVLLISAIIVVVGMIFCYLYFGTDLIKKESESIDSKSVSETKDVSSPSEPMAANSTSEPVDVEQEQYNKAMQLITEEKYADAMDILMDIAGYKDSNNQLKLLYSKYSGYYKNDEKNITLHFQILANNRASAEVIGFVDGKQVKITENTLLDSHTAIFDFLDSENNQGILTIDIKNNNLDMALQTDSEASTLNLGNHNITFNIKEKSDVPFKEEITADTLMEFVKNKTTISQLNQRGINTTFLNPLYKDTGSSAYGVDNTDIKLAIYTFDISKTDMHEFYGDDNTNVDDPIIFGVSAPAEMIIPEYIGKQNDPFVKDDILFVPDGELCQYGHTLDFYYSTDFREIKNIESSTPVCFTSKALIGESNFDELVEFYTNPSPLNVESTEDDTTMAEIDDYVYPDEITNIKDPNEDNLWMDDSPNEWCPKCGKGYIITGVGIDGLTCDECGCVWLPTCYVCGQADADSIWDEDSGTFRCVLCGAEWNP